MKHLQIFILQTCNRLKDIVFSVLYYSLNLITRFCAKYFEFVIICCVIKGIICTGVFYCLMCLNMIILLYNLVRLSGYIRVSVDTQISTSTSVCEHFVQHIHLHLTSGKFNTNWPKTETKSITLQSCHIQQDVRSQLRHM